ncbi:MAG: heavy metal translocating P-type ATPase [Planctomycetaceae bacterium]|nr:heavy metal translocating P-type ATPase [Planctomycetaceae bacterium]
MKVIELDNKIVEHYSVVAIEEALRRFSGVVDISHIEATSQILVYCNDDTIDATALISVLDDQTLKCLTPITDAQIPVDLSGTPMKCGTDVPDAAGVIRLTVSGMHCGACAAIVEGAIQNISGVDDAAVSLVTSQAVVFHRNVSWTSIVHALEKRGYSGDLITSPHDVLRRLRTENTSKQRTWLRRWVMSGVGVVLLLALIPLSLGSEIHWWLALAIATVVQVLVGGVYIKSASKLALTGASNMDTLIAIGTSAAYLGGLVFQEAGIHLLMDAPMILTFVSFGKWIEVRARQTTVAELSKVDVMNCQTAHLLVGAETQDVATSELALENRILVRPGEVVPTDGKVVEGESTVNQSWLTGESTPQAVGVGDRVFGGTINRQGLLTIEVDVVPGDNRLHKMTQVLEKSLESRVPLQTLADSIVHRFVPCLLVIGVITFVAWVVIGRGVSENYVQDAWKYTVSVLIVACPCALGLATPVALLVMSIRSVGEGVLFGNPLVMEQMGKISTLILDKTGTVTANEISVKTFEFVQHDNYPSQEEVLGMGVAVEKQCNHPLALAIVAFGEAQSIESNVASDVQHALGGGVSGLVNGKRVAIGNRAFIQSEIEYDGVFNKIVEDSNGSTYICVDSNVVGVFDFDAELLPDVKDDIARIKLDTNRSVEVRLATGDNQQVADDVALRVGIEYVHAELAPEEKVKLVLHEQSEGNVVAMAGDGVNDAIALVAADIGIAVARGADLATEVADVVLLKPGLSGISRAIRLSKQTRKIILQNICWAFLYNITLIPIAAGCFASFGVKISPWLAAGAMACSSLFVVFNSLRLRIIAIA